MHVFCQDLPPSVYYMPLVVPPSVPCCPWSATLLVIIIWPHFCDFMPHFPLPNPHFHSTGHDQDLQQISFDFKFHWPRSRDPLAISVHPSMHVYVHGDFPLLHNIPKLSNLLKLVERDLKAANGSAFGRVPSPLPKWRYSIFLYPRGRKQIN